MKVTLQVNGREMTFFEEELTAILEKHFTKEEERGATIIEKTRNELSKNPAEEKCFLVQPETIKRAIFTRPRKDPKQESLRKLILEAFCEANKNPKYAKPFEIMIPVKTWESRTEEEHIAYAENEGGHITNWIEQCLEWAQRISDGEPWENICNQMDTASWYRLVIWKNGEIVLIGGPRMSTTFLSASDVSKCARNSIYVTDHAVPSITRNSKRTFIE